MMCGAYRTAYGVLAWGQSLQMFLEFNLLGAGELSEGLDL